MYYLRSFSDGFSNTLFLFVALFATTPSLLSAQQIEADEHWSQQFGGAIEFNEKIEKVVTAGNALFAMGSFSRVGDNVSEGLARWNGVHWESMLGGECNYADSFGITASCQFQEVYSHNDTLFALAIVKTVEDPDKGLTLLRWEDAGWVRTFKWDGRGDLVNDVLVEGDSVYLAGRFTTDLENDATLAVRGVVRWDGEMWHPVGGVVGPPHVLGGSVRKLAMVGDELYVAGNFIEVDGLSANHVARWDGTEWRTLDDIGFTDLQQIYDMAVDGQNNLYVVGNFSSVNEMPSPYGIGIWDGTEWSVFDDPNALPHGASRIEVIGDSVFVRGVIFNSSFGLSDTGNFKMGLFDGQSWKAVRGRLDTSVLVSLSDMTVYNGEVVLAYNNAVQRLTPEGFRSLDGPNAGLNGYVEDMAIDEQGVLYVVGDFNEAGGKRP